MPNLPEKFRNEMKKILGEEYEAFLKSYEDIPKQGLRLNRSKISNESFERLIGTKLERINWIDNGYYLKNEFNATKHPYYYAGLYYIQEPSAQTPANILKINRGDRVLDLCAAPGGKSTELAAKLDGSGVLVSNDISITRAKALVKNLNLFGIKNAVITSEEPKKLAKVFEGYFDKILVDAPCSGEGMFRKEPAVIKNWEQYGNDYYSNLQKEILEYAVKMLADDGYLLYSTCTFSAKENEGSIDYILNKFDNLEVIDINNIYEGFSAARPELVDSSFSEIAGAIRLWPHKLAGEGHFICLLHKKTQKNVNVENNFNKETKLTKEEKMFLSDWGLTYEELSKIEVISDKLYLVPKNLPKLEKIRILRKGLYLGDRKKNRFEPSTAFAMSLKMEAAKNTINLPATDSRIIKYLRCETIDITDKEKEEQLSNAMETDYVLICVDSYPLGFAKLMGNTLKNKYFAGWRMM